MDKESQNIVINIAGSNHSKSLGCVIIILDTILFIIFIVLVLLGTRLF